MHGLVSPGICTSLLARSICSSAKCSNHRSAHAKNTAPLSTGTVINVPSATLSVILEKVEGRKTPLSCHRRHTGPRPCLTSNKSYRIVSNRTIQVLISSMTLEWGHWRGVAEPQGQTAACPKRCRTKQFIYNNIYAYVLDFYTCV